MRFITLALLFTSSLAFAAPHLGAEVALDAAVALKPTKVSDSGSKTALEVDVRARERAAIQARQWKGPNRLAIRSDPQCPDKPAPTTGSCLAPGNPLSSGCGKCGSQCIDLQRNDNNCGTCGNKCGSGSTCNNGRCEVVGCDGLGVKLSPLGDACLCTTSSLVNVGSSKCQCDPVLGLTLSPLLGTCVCLDVLHILKPDGCHPIQTCGQGEILNAITNTCLCSPLRALQLGGNCCASGRRLQNGECIASITIGA